MKPLRFAVGEIFKDDTAPRSRYAFDHLYLPPRTFSKCRMAARLPKGEYPEAGAFGNGPLLKSIGSFAININRALDRDNQITVHIPDPCGRSVFIHGNNELTVHHVKESIEAILDSYAENLGNKDFNLHTVAAPEASRAKRFIDCLKAFTSASFMPVPEAARPAALMPADLLMERYLKGISVENLAYPERDIAFASVDLDYGFREIYVSDFERDERNNRFSNMPVFDDEKILSAESAEAYSKYWDINRFEGGKADYFRKFKSFLLNELSVKVSVSEYHTARIELRGHPDNVAIAERIARRAVPLLNEGQALQEKDGKLGKPLDKEWLENALSDARRHFAVKAVSEKLGVTVPSTRTISRKAEPKDYPDFHLPGFAPA